MKTLRNSIIAMCALFAASCTQDDVENRPVVQGIDAPVLIAPEAGNPYVLSPETMDLQAERFIWTDANFGEGIIPAYDIEIDYAGQNFDTPVIVASTAGDTQISVSTNVLNTALLNLGATPFVGANFDVRIKAYVGSEVLYSNSAEIIATPYTTETPRLWIAGDYQAASGYGADWTPSSGAQLLATGYGDTHFEGYVYFANAANFKFTTQADWNGTNYGQGATANKIDAAGGDIASPAGYYKVTVNTAATSMEYTLTAANWGVIGSATAATTGGDGWGADMDMTYDPATKKWTVTTPLAAGEIKFRASDAWALNYGDDGADNSLNEGGANIAIAAAGTYKVTLDTSNPRAYTYTVELQ
jgi:starch-binding outer membrane protein SusE/F